MLRDDIGLALDQPWAPAHHLAERHEAFPKTQVKG
jgi:hypothetical protein